MLCSINGTTKHNVNIVSFYELDAMKSWNKNNKRKQQQKIFKEKKTEIITLNKKEISYCY